MTHLSRRSTLVSLVAASMACGSRAAGAADVPGLVRKGFVYDKADFPSCHASTIAETESGEWTLAFFGGTDEGKRDVSIWFARKEGETWSAPSRIVDGVQADGTRWPCWNPVLFQPKGKPLTLFYKVGESPKVWWGMAMTSRDDGRTWSKPERLPDGVLGPIKNKPIELEDGTLLCGSSTEDSTEAPRWRVHFERRERDGAWTKSADVEWPTVDGEAVDAIQPTILRNEDGSVVALGRTRNKRVFQTTSRDGGKTWSPMTMSSLPNPNSGIDGLTLRDGRHLLVYNPTENGERTPLCVALSHDGKTWKDAVELDRDADLEAEFSYPACCQGRDGLVHVTYTWRREKIAYAILDPTRLATR